MNASVSAEISVESRGRRYVFWRAVQRSAITLAAVGGICSIVFVVLIIVESVISNRLVENSGYALLSPFTGGHALGCVVLYHVAREKANKYADSRFKPYSYRLVLKALRKKGVKKPVSHLNENPLSVDAYLKTLNVARFRIILPENERSKIQPLFFWRLSSEVLEEHKVAALVLPGADELLREDRIKHMIMDRGIGTYRDIKELLEQYDIHPTPLSEGAL